MDEEWVFISVAARQSGLHPQTLRVYEMRGLITPGRSERGTRRYCAEDIIRLQRIRELADLGINQAGIAMILDLEERLRRALGP